MVALAAVMTVATVLVCSLQDLPITDPDDDVAGAAYIRFPLFLLAAFAVDVVPRALWRARREQERFAVAFREVLRRRWTREQVRFTLVGLVGWYVCYATFRNLKNAVPFVNSNLWDKPFERLDHLLWFGHDPAQALHSLFGQGFAAQVFSLIYVTWIVLIPLGLTWALVWTRNRAIASWFVTAIAVDWAIGASTYFLFPTLGPIYSDPRSFAGLEHTMVSGLQKSMYEQRTVVLNNPTGHHTLQSIAAFASLHVGLMVTMCLLLELWAVRRWTRILAWVFLVATSLATIYLGWHFFVDTLGGIVVGAAAVWVSALGTGNHDGWRPKLVPDPEPAAQTTLGHRTEASRRA
ncbi:inositol phosphorylceramide synthase [Nocardioides mangrovicus]|uniref:Inositol phosphorylceramide synthase n=1 Tax=Nocardioides mangrovicus TaxID=2478913 RepID=A0A3L8P438_9ACTN|nr:phosphatase PAP2 family protein [Nocardioides mangrovicus]RLV49812.1 inositol phosphorylceramide synthase [Nocardioides mangrovicus]